MPESETAVPDQATTLALTPFWVSWWCAGAFTWWGPWWISGTQLLLDGGTQNSICAAVMAADEADAQELIRRAHDDTTLALEWRFVEARPADWSPFQSDRFPRARWMKWPHPAPEGVPCASTPDPIR